MLTRILYSFCFITLISSLSYSQGGHYGGHNENVKELCKILQTSNFSTNTAADKALDRILAVTGMSKNFTLYPCSDIENCAAVTYNGDRYILYDKEFMEDISNSTSSWSNLSILAHEIGHHVNGHTLDLVVYASGGRDAPTLAKKRQEELEADEYSGFVMQKLGATLEQAQAAVKLYGFDGDDTYETHPNKSKRLNAIKNGFDRAKKTEKTKVETKVVYIEKESNKVIKEEVVSIPEITSGILNDTRDNMKYKTVKIGDQIWMAQNLAFSPSFGSFTNYHDDFLADDLRKFWGYLYDWETACKVCPTGWHLPTAEDWNKLIENLGGEEVASVKMKSKSGWKNNSNGTNESGFNGFPAGYYLTGDILIGIHMVSKHGYWWSSTQNKENGYWSRTLDYNKNIISGSNGINHHIHFSVRCIKD